MTLRSLLLLPLLWAPCSPAQSPAPLPQDPPTQPGDFLMRYGSPEC